MIGTINNKNLNISNFTKLNEIIITGLDEKNNEQMINNLSFLKLDNFFFLDEQKIKEVIDLNNLVEEYSVFRKYPSTLKIEIDQTEFLAVTIKNENNFFLGSNGKLIEVIESRKDLPFIFGNFSIENFFRLKKAVDESNFEYTEIKNFFFFKSGRWDIETNSGLLIKLPQKNIKKSLQLMISFLEKENDKKISEIDLRQNNQIIING